MDLAITQLSAPMTAETNARTEGVAPSKREADEMSTSDRKRHARMRQLRNHCKDEGDLKKDHDDRRYDRHRLGAL